ncbi:MAG TPA: extracellular solute-binding protein [Terriglobales bacterium]|nr:extracellular solute-binding protein [Terriglobales bacterium]
MGLIKKAIGLMAIALSLGMSVLTVRSAKAEEVVNLYSWADYFPDDAIKAFEKETGIEVKYDTFDSNEVLETKLSIGGSGYDVVVPNASPHLARQIPAKMYLTLDRSKLTQYGNLDPELLAVLAHADPGNQHAVPWMWGTTGLIYNRAAILKRIPDAKFDSLALLLDPANVAKLKDCGISIADSAGEMIPATLAYLGKPPYSKNPADIALAVEHLRKITPFVKTFATAGQSNGMAEGELCLSFGYSGDAFIAQSRATEAKNGITVDYAIPHELTMAWIDTLAIPADAPHPANAYKFIDFMLRAKSAADATTAYGFASGNKAALTLLDPAIRDNPRIYPPAQKVSNMLLTPPLGHSYDRAIERAWTTVKSGE